MVVVVVVCVGSDMVEVEVVVVVVGAVEVVLSVLAFLVVAGEGWGERRCFSAAEIVGGGGVDMDGIEMEHQPLSVAGGGRGFR